MKVIGLMINSMAKELKTDQMDQDMMGNIKMGKSMDLENLHGPMEALTKEILEITIFMALECIAGLMGENILELDLIIKCMEEENFHGLMAENILENILMIKKKDMKFLNGLMGKNMKEFGLMVREKLLVIIPIHRIKDF